MAVARFSRFAKAYSFAIAALVGLSIAGYLHTNAGIKAEAGFTEAVNVSGRQRLLTEHAALQAYQLIKMPAQDADRSRLIDASNETLSELRAHGAMLLGTNEAATFPPHIYETMRELYRASGKPVPDLVSEYSALITRTQVADAVTSSDLWRDIEVKEAEVMEAIDQATRGLSVAAEERLANVKQRNLNYLLAMLGSLALLGFFVFRPMDRQILAEKQSLIDAKESLEERVVDRTHEVEMRAEELARQEAKLRAILDTTIDGIITTDLHGNIMTLNPAAEKMFGFKADEVIGTNLVMLMPEHLRDEQSLSLRGFMESDRYNPGRSTHELMMEDKSGRNFPVEIAFREQTVGKKRLFTAILRDITEIKEIEQMKNEFISLVSHELRTPLTSIRGSLGLIAGGVMGELPEKVGSLIDIASNNSERLVRLINDILDIEKIEAGKMAFDLQPQAVLPLIEQAVEGNTSFAKKCGVRFEVVNEVPGAKVSVHADRIRQVLDNLLSNAIKFSPEEEAVEIAITREGEHIRVSVSDRGPGVSKEFQAQIFEKFSQADSSTTRSKGGTGLGLSISKAIVERHQGIIGYDNQPGEGATFYFELPEIQIEIEEPAVEPVSPSGPADVLICEDNADVAKLMHLMLKGAGIASDIAYSAQQARELLRKRNYKAMTLDLMLPDEDGIALLRELRANQATHDLPIIVVSAIAAEGKAKINGAGIHVIDWLSKPIDEDRLLRAISGTIDARHSERPHILHVEDDPDIRSVVAGMVSDTADLSFAASLGEAHRRLEERRFDLVILDIMLPDGSGLELLDVINRASHPTPVVIFSAKDVDEQTAKRVSASLVKARTSNEQLIDQVRTVLGAEALLVEEGGNMPLVTE